METSIVTRVTYAGPPSASPLRRPETRTRRETTGPTEKAEPALGGPALKVWSG